MLSNFIDDVKRWFRNEPPILLDATPESIDEMAPDMRGELVKRRGCVTCDDNPKFEVYAGPQGGMSQNCWCPQCGTRYNVTQWESLLLVDIIHKFEKWDEFNKDRGLEDA